MEEVQKLDTAMLSIEDTKAETIAAGGFVRRSDRVRKAPERFITVGPIKTIGQPVIDIVVPELVSILKKNTADANGASTLKRKASTSKAAALAKRRQLAEGPSENGSIAQSDSMPMREVDPNEKIMSQEISANHTLNVSDTAPIELSNISIAETLNVEATSLNIYEIDDPRDEDFVPASNTAASDDSEPTTTPPLQDGIVSNTSGNELPENMSPMMIANINVVPPGPLVSRPEPLGIPLVWAEGRQALCETLPYYRSYQSGAYCTNGLAYGFMLGEDDVTSRPYMDDEIVIARAGGGCKLNAATGRMEQVTDHVSTAPDIKSFRSNMIQKVPIILIVSQQNRQCPTELPHQYCVMDYFQVTLIWPEKNSGKICFMYRLEKIDRSTKSWWMPKDHPSRPNPPIYAPAATRTICPSCNIESIQIFQFWMCLNEHCGSFWTINGDSPTEELEYNPQFLEERTAWPQNVRAPFEIVPQLPYRNSESADSDAFSRLHWKGVVCRRCGRCNSRRHWDSWRCATARCGYVYQLPQPILSPQAVLDEHEVSYMGHAAPLDTYTLPVTLDPVQFSGEWRIHTYELCPGNVIVHFHANNAANSLTNGANDLFKALQKDNRMGLQRFPLKQHIGRGEVLAQHFAINYGMPYNYVVAVGSESFRAAPAEIRDAMQCLEWAASSSVPYETNQGFNEMLAVGYFESNKMGFHDDGEKELGPTIATLSLGGRATMSLRMKERYYRGFTKGGKYNPREPLLPGCAFEEDRKSLNNKWGKVSDKQFGIEVNQLSKRLNRKNSPVFLNMTLCHGDIVIMHGAEMQKYYEHRVTPSGKLRFALTTRHVKPEMVDTAEHWKGVWKLPAEEIYDDTAVDAVTAAA